MRKLLWLALLAACGSPPELAVPRDEDTRAPESEDLRSALRDESYEIRVRAARAMGRIQSLSYAPDLVAALEDRSREVKLEAIFALGQMAFAEDWEAGKESAISPHLLARLGDTHDALRAATVEALGKLGGAGVEGALAALAADPDAGVRAEVALAIFRLRFTPEAYFKIKRPFAPESVDALLKLLDDADEEVRWRAAYALSRWQELKAGEKLVKALDSPNRWTRIFATRALGKFKDAQPIDALTKAAADADAMVRVDAALAFGSLGRADAIPAALDKDPSAHVRRAVAIAVGRTAKKECVDRLKPLLRDASPMVRAEAVTAAAGLLGEDFGGELLQHVGDAHWWVRSRAYLAAGELPERGLRIIQQGLADGDVRVAASALEALKKIQKPEAITWTAQFLRSEKADLEMRGTAVDVAADKKSPELLPALKDCYHNSLSRNFVEVRESIVDAVDAIGGPDATAFIEEILRDDAPSVRAKAAKKLKREAPAPPRPDVSRFIGRTPAHASVVLETEKGEIEIECCPDDAPVHVASFVELAGAGRYDGTIIHRVEPNFVVQGGDPRGTGWGDAGYFIRDEINRLRYDRGTVGMPKAGKDTGGCQIFITHTPTPHLDGRYTVFGRVTRGMDVVDRLEQGDRILKARVR